jgi:hypothetical protein
VIRQELKAVRSDIAKAQGIIIAAVCIMQSIGILMGG